MHMKKGSFWGSGFMYVMQLINGVSFLPTCFSYCFWPNFNFRFDYKLQLSENNSIDLQEIP